MVLQFHLPPDPPLAAVGLSSLAPTEIDTLARTVWGEARGEALEGQAAVAWTVVNRVLLARGPERARYMWWGDSVHGVCLAKAQFSCWLPSDPNFDKMRAAHLGTESFVRAWGVAALVLSGDLADPTGGATHYFSAAGNFQAPSWTLALTPSRVIGSQRFFREPTR